MEFLIRGVCLKFFNCTIFRIEHKFFAPAKRRNISFWDVIFWKTKGDFGSSQRKSAMTHSIPDDKLRLISEMDKKIGEFMQKRADVVNKIIYDTAVLKTGDFVKIYDNEDYLCSGSIIQPLFLKREGIITYRVKKEDGEVFTNETFRLVKI